MVANLRALELEHIAATREFNRAVETDSAEEIREAERVLNATLDKRYDALRGLATSEAGVPPELLAKARLDHYVNSVIEERKIDGAELELLQEMGVPDTSLGQQNIPLAVLGKDIVRIEARADTATTLNAGDFDTQIYRPVLPVFADSDAQFLGIPVQTVSPGEQRIPVITDSNDAEIKAKGATVDGKEAMISTRKFNPTRISKRYLFAMEEVYTWGGNMLATSLTDVMRRGIMDKLDDAVLNGSGVAPQPLGIFGNFKGTGLPSNPGSESDWAAYLQSVTGQVDGIHAKNESDMRLLVGVSTWAHMRSKRVGTNSAIDAVKGIQELGGRVMASSRVPAVASTRQDAILALSGPSAERGFWIGTWNVAQLIRDPYTKSDTAQIALTMHLMFDCGGAAIPDDIATNNAIEGMKRLRFQVE